MDVAQTTPRKTQSHFYAIQQICQMEIVKKIDLTKGVIVITSRHE